MNTLNYSQLKQHLSYNDQCISTGTQAGNRVSISISLNLIALVGLYFLFFFSNLTFEAFKFVSGEICVKSWWKYSLVIYSPYLLSCKCFSVFHLKFLGSCILYLSCLFKIWTKCQHYVINPVNSNEEIFIWQRQLLTITSMNKTNKQKQKVKRQNQRYRMN